MSIIGRLEKSIRNDLALSNPKAWSPSAWNLAGAQSPSGETVTEQTALTYSAFWNAITLISGTIGALPLHLMQGKGKTKRIAEDRVMYRVLHDCANTYMTAMQFRECLQAHVLGWGNGYAEKVRNGYGEMVALWPITPNRVTPMMVEGRLVYRIQIPGDADKYLSRENIFHVAGLGFDGFVGYSVVAMARKSIGLGMAMETFGSRFFGEGTHPGVVIQHPGKLSPEAHSNLKQSLGDTYSGLGKTHRLMLLEESMTFQKIVIDPKDSQFLESRQFNIPEIARWFNLPPHKLKDLTKSSFSNIESEQISFVTDSILPWLVRLEQSFNMQLLTESDREYSGRGRLYFKHNVEGLLRADAAARGTYYKEMWNTGAMTQNQIRALEDMDPDPNPLADELFVPMNMIPLSKVNEYLAKKPAEPEPTGTDPIPDKGNGKDKSAGAVDVKRLRQGR